MTLEVGMRGIRGISSRAAKVTLLTLCVCLMGAIFAAGLSDSAAAPTIEGTTVSAVTSTSAVLEAKVGTQGKATRYHFQYGTQSCASNPCISVPVPEGELPAASSPVLVKVPVESLAPATIYHYRLLAKNGESALGSERIFTTYANTAAGLPDGRAYEQSSPANKNGGDAVGQHSLVKTTPEGNSVTFGSTFGFPGGKGAQGFPDYLASRGASTWSTQGLLPPPSVGERDKVIGWLPDYSEVFTQVTRLGKPRKDGLVGQSTKTQALVTIGLYRPKAQYAYVGASKDNSTVFFEARVALPPKEGEAVIPGAVEGASNVYAWDRASEKTYLVGALNKEAETKAALPKGSFAGPYDWSRGSDPISLTEGGANRGYYLQGMRAITPSGSIYFTAANSGQLYLRVNPTKEQSPVNGEGKCTNAALACTLRLSVSKRTVPDPVGEQPAAFQAASADGSEAFFTSSEKLTNNANTGPEQPKAAIGRSALAGGIEDAQFIPKRAVGVTVDGSHVYWADPSKGTIGRADLGGTSVDPNFIIPPPGECEVEVKEGKQMVFKKVSIPSTPRYVAVDAGHIYWTNTGLHGELELPVEGGGTIGRADINGSEVDPDFICGEKKATQPGEPAERLISNPQGIAVNATHIYWANAAMIDPTKCSIARASIDGSEVEWDFQRPLANRAPYGVALSATHVYYDPNDEENNGGYIARTPLEGGEEEYRFVGEAGLRGMAIEGEHLYWASQSEGAIGRSDLALGNIENKFIEIPGKLNGLAANPEHLYWTANGEGAGNPGADLYRYEPGGEVLSDLTPLATGNGAEVQGVLGVSADGSYVYFAANGVLAAGASQGTCKGPVRLASGKCNLYLLHDGQVSFIAPLDAEHGSGSDAIDWVGTAREALNTGSYFPKTSFLSADGKTLLFRSQNQLGTYESKGVPEFYRFDAEEPTQLRCVSCRPSGEDASEGPSLGSLLFPQIQPESSALEVQSRNFSADGNHFFFESSEALSPEDTNGQVECPFSGTSSQAFPKCLDVYEWEAPGTGSCSEGGPSFSSFNGGCVYLISTGKSEFPSLFADASESGEDVFFFTRQGLVGQDKDELQDVYDARVGGGLASQNPITPVPCESTEACHGPAQSPPVESTPVTPNFEGPGNKVEKHKKQNHKKKKHKGKKKHHKAKAKGRTQR
jgi:hypothetical protein